jgi:hypothetical protein
MIYINPTGGLGNALFQIATIHTLALKNNDSVCLLNIKKFINDLNMDIRVGTKHAEKYRYILDRFQQFDFAPTEWKSDQKFSIPFEHNSFLKTFSPFQYEKLIYKPNYEYVGYFQSEKYFIDNRHEILKIFTPTDEVNNNVNNYSEFFNCIGLHVRRGDYVNEHMGRYIYLDMNYYNNALLYLPKDLPVLIFSDDLEWCKENFIGDRFVFIDELDYIALYIMSKMKYFIIANSSFSWWGAWLSNAETILAPKEWFSNTVKHKPYEYNIVPDNWIKI